MFLCETKRTLNADLQVLKFAQVVFVPNRSNYTGRLVCLDRESLCLENDPDLFSGCARKYLQRFFKKVHVEGPTSH